MEARFFTDILDRTTNPRGFIKEYTDFLREDGKTIKIRKIVITANGLCAQIYYETSPKPTTVIKESDRFSDMDLDSSEGE